jgi:hypothetical protein
MLSLTLSIGSARVSLTLPAGLVGMPQGARLPVSYSIALPDGGAVHVGSDLHVIVRASEAAMLASTQAALLSFLSAAGESYAYAGADGETADLFPLPVAEWAAEFADELAMASEEADTFAEWETELADA